MLAELLQVGGVVGSWRTCCEADLVDLLRIGRLGGLATSLQTCWTCCEEDLLQGLPAGLHLEAYNKFRCLQHARPSSPRWFKMLPSMTI
jgi:hypothetical protein